MKTMANSYRKTFAFVSLFALALPAAGNASDSSDSQTTQNASSDSQSGLAEIVVTAQKRAERAEDVPISMSVISGDRLIETQNTTLQDIANAVPGLQMVSTSADENTLIIRGIYTGSGINGAVATYVDEVPYTAAGAFSGSSTISPNFDPYDLARVEVLRGPQGTLYGATALGGLLKYVTNAPDPSGYSASFLLGGNDVEHGGTGYELHGMINVPLGPTAAFRLTASDTYFPGYIDDPSRGLTDINGVRRENVRASLLWNATGDLTIRLTAAYQRLTAGDYNDVDLNASTLRPIYGDLSIVRDFSQPQLVENAIFNSTINWNLGFASLTSSTSWTKVNPYDFLDDSAAFGPLLDSIFGGNLGTVLEVRIPEHSIKQELRLTSAVQHPLEWTVGVYYDDEVAQELQGAYITDLNTKQLLPDFQPPLGVNIFDSTYREYATFADINYDFTSAFEVGVGARYSKNMQTYHEFSDGFFFGNEDFGSDSGQNVTTYSVDAKYRFTPELMAYARVATGYVPGGPNNAIPGNNLPPTFQSSTTTNYELGIKGSADDGRISYDADVFDIQWQRIQLYAEFTNSENLSFAAITNGGTARSRGLEGTFQFRPVKEVTLMLNGAYTDARLTENTPPSFGGLDGDRLPQSPFFAGTASVDYERPIGSNLSVFAGIDDHYNGSRLSDFTPGVPRVVIPGYSLVDLRAGVKVHRYTISAYVKNAGDARPINNVVPETLANGQSAYAAAVGMPRTIGLNVSGNF
jgi:outer membrane receptor protein involved in Fe transport